MEAFEMKKVFITLLLISVYCVFSSFGSTKITKYSFSEQLKKEYYYNSILSKPESHKFISDDIVDLVKNIIPEQYIGAFLHYTDLGARYRTDVFRLYILGLGQLESEWMVVRSYKINDNGTYDHGYLMLNDHNIGSQRFMDVYGPTPDFAPHDRISLYLITCINYFKDLYLRYGCDALYAYNAGEYSYINNTIPDSTYIYKYQVKRIIDKLIDSLYVLSIENKRIRNKVAMEEIRLKLKKEAEFIKLRNSWDLLNIVYRLTHDAYFGKPLGGHVVYQQILYDPRRKILKTIDLHSFYIPCFVNTQEIENTLA
jgi:hypothetical protein